MSSTSDAVKETDPPSDGQGTGNIQRHQLPPHQPTQQQQPTQNQAAQHQPGTNVTIRAQNLQQAAASGYIFPQQMPYILQSAGPPGQMIRYPAAYPATPYNPQYPQGQQYVTPQQQHHIYAQAQQQINAYNAAAYASAVNYLKNASQQPQNPMHHGQPAFYPPHPSHAQPVPAVAYMRAGVPAAMPVQQKPTQQSHAAHPVTVQGHQPKLTAATAQSVLMQPTVIPGALVTEASMPANQPQREPPVPKKKRILLITDPNTGKVLIAGNAGSRGVASQPAAEPVDLPADGQGKNKAKSDFFQLITTAADEALTATVPPERQREHKSRAIQRRLVTLHMAEDPWKPGRNYDDTKDKEQILIEEMKKNTQEILNKLNLANFDKLLEKFLMLKFEEEVKEPEKRSAVERAKAEEVTSGRIGAVISVFYEQAINDPVFSGLYAKMVHIVGNKAPAVTSKIFRKKILEQCDKEFHNGTSIKKKMLLQEKLAVKIEDKKTPLKLEIEEKRFLARWRRVGNVRFIGELYKLEMLTLRVMVQSVNLLISNGDEESLECLCKLLTTVGHTLEENIAQMIETMRIKKPPPSKWVPDSNFMNNTFTKLKALSDDGTYSSRIRFALLDVVELRASSWVPRREVNAPKTKEEVRRAMIREEQEEKKQLMNLPPASSPRGPKKIDEWMSVSVKKSSRFSAAATKTGPDSSGELPKLASGDGPCGLQSARVSATTEEETNNTDSVISTLQSGGRGDQILEMDKELEELKITAVESAQIEPIFTNGGNEIDEGMGDDDIEEGELHEGDMESDESGEPVKKGRIVYDRDTLINIYYNMSANKDLVQRISDSILSDLIRDDNSSFNIGPPPRSQGVNYGVAGGSRKRNFAKGGRKGNNNVGPFPNPLTTKTS